MVQLADTSVSKAEQVLVQIQLHAHYEFSLKVEPIAYTYQTEEHYLQLVPVISLRVEHGTDTSDTVEHYHHHGPGLLVHK